MDAIRKQLDVLMGANRNGDVREVNRKYYDRDVCRLYLVGLCPHELFQLTEFFLPHLLFSHLNFDTCSFFLFIVLPENGYGPLSKGAFSATTKRVSLMLAYNDSFPTLQRYEEAKAKGPDNYDRDLEDVIDRLIVECDRKIQRALKRLEDEDAKAAIAISVSEVTQTPEVLELSKQIKEKLKEVDQHDLEGNTDHKIRALEVVEELRAKRADKQSMLLLDAFNKDRASLPQPLQNPPSLAPLPMLAPPDPRTQEMINEKLKKAEDLAFVLQLAARQEPGPDTSKYTAADVRITDQKLRVCDICGAFLSVYDSDRRLADHFGGKLHLGYMQIREKLAELQNRLVACAGIMFPILHRGLSIRMPSILMELRSGLFGEGQNEFLRGQLNLHGDVLINSGINLVFRKQRWPSASVIWLHVEERNKSRKTDRSEDRRSKERGRDDRAPSRDRDRDKDGRGDSRDGVKDYDRRSRDRDRHRDRDRGYDRERERDSDRSRGYDSRSRRRSRSRERSRDYDRPRRYDRH
ncbi:hypothetical protein Syun_030334 [Stephania yunnanensis]|uniref:Uncharacterized protein n=1 Tax=Stephania yunnanensis TaxID=152371 RepID=A0AAP0E738_9MAGN